MSQATKQRISCKRAKAAPGVPRDISGASGHMIKGNARDGTAELLGTRVRAEKAAKRGANGRQSLERGRREGFVLGHAAFAKICAVEGLHFTAEMKRDLQRLDREGLSPEARREFLIAKYGK